MSDPEGGRVIDLEQLSSVGAQQMIAWRGHRFEIMKVTEVTPGFFQCVLRDLDEPNRPPVSVPGSDLVDAEPLDD